MPLIRLLLESTPLLLDPLLRELGFDLTSAPRIAEALELISSGAFGVLLSSLHTPGTGWGRASHVQTINRSRLM